MSWSINSAVSRLKILIKSSISGSVDFSNHVLAAWLTIWRLEEKNNSFKIVSSSLFPAWSCLSCLLMHRILAASLTHPNLFLLDRGCSCILMYVDVGARLLLFRFSVLILDVKHIHSLGFTCKSEPSFAYLPYIGIAGRSDPTLRLHI